MRSARRGSGECRSRGPLTREEWRALPVQWEDDGLVIGGWQVMQGWEKPLMEVLAREVTVSPGDVLEVGFGMGMAAREIVRRGCRTYTVIEAHPQIAETAREWATEQPVPAEVIEGFWQCVAPGLKRRFDGILFDTFPLSDAERGRNHFEFIPQAPALLRPGGVLTLYSDETLDFRQEHLKLLLTHFNEVKLVKVTGLRPPADCEYWQSATMVIPVAKRTV